MRAVRYHPAARAEFLHEVEYYAHISPVLAEHYDAAVHAAEYLAASNPEAWPKFGRHTRRVIDRRFNFSLVYLHDDEEVYVVAIAPTKRKPGYWKGRLGAA